MITVENKNLNCILTLSARALNGTALTEDEKASMDDIDALRCLAKFHSIGALTYHSLEKAGITDAKWSEIRDKALRNMVLQNLEREKMFDAFKKAESIICRLRGLFFIKCIRRIICAKWLTRTFLLT